jgi:hypothetical protein
MDIVAAACCWMAGRRGVSAADTGSSLNNVRCTLKMNRARKMHHG